MSSGDQENSSPPRQGRRADSVSVKATGAGADIDGDACWGPREGPGRPELANVREITLEMSPCLPVGTCCGFTIGTQGVRGVGQ